jgi:uncharacterized membrane protein
VPDCRRSKRGFVLIATCISLIFLMGVAGLGIDIGRMYLIKSELQAFADAAALSAALQVDGSDQGVKGAQQAPAELATGPNAMMWDMGTKPITDVSTSFAKGETVPDASSWQVEPKSAEDLHFVRVVVTVQAPVIFLRAFQPMKTDAATVAVVSVAMKTPQSARLVQ